MRLLTNQEVRQLQLAIMDDVHEFCIKNNIRYSLGGGTLLGSIRHKGYIPWDDDIDLMMPRPDYERFLKEYKGKEPYFEIDYYTNDPQYISAFAKVIDNRTYTVGPNIIDDKNVFIDIFPVDGMPEKNELKPYVEQIQTILENLRKNGKYYLFEKSLPKKVMFFIKYLIKSLTIPSRKKNFRMLEELIAKYPFGASPHAGVAVSQYSYKEWMELSVFEKFQPSEFEGRQYMILSAYDTYLRGLYNDYMQLPPEDQRVPMHLFEVYLK